MLACALVPLVGAGSAYAGTFDGTISVVSVDPSGQVTVLIDSEPTILFPPDHEDSNVNAYGYQAALAAIALAGNTRDVEIFTTGCGFYCESIAYINVE